jgi:RND family efflux transporter MFP subunit
METREPTAPGWKAPLLLSLAVLLAAAAALAAIFLTEPTARREGATKETAMLVRVVPAEAGIYRPTITATGSVRPVREIVLRPRVASEVTAIAEAFDPGGRVAKGETLLRLDPSDFRHRLRQRRGDLREARAELALERGRQAVAEQEYRLLGEELSGVNRDLVLRQPQLRAARSRVETAQAAVDQAELDLSRTTITAPFDAHILTREVDVGSQVSAGDRLARLVGVDAYWVEATVPVAKLPWLALPEDGEPGARVRVRDRGAWPEGQFRAGRLYRLIGSLGERTRLARVLARIPDPLAREAEGPRLLIGAYVHTRIRGRPLEGVVRLEREHLRKDDTVWVMADGELDIRAVEVVLRDANYAYIREGLSGGERVVVSDLATVKQGAPLRLAEDSGAGGGGEPAAP